MKRARAKFLRLLKITIFDTLDFFYLDPLSWQLSTQATSFSDSAFSVFVHTRERFEVAVA